MNYSKLPEALEKSLIEWRTRQTKKRLSTSLNAFADYLGFSRPIVSLWLNGDRTPTQENAELLLQKMVELIGDEAYDGFGLSHPNLDLQALTEIWDRIPPKIQHELREHGEQYVVKNEEPSNVKEGENDKLRSKKAP